MNLTPISIKKTVIGFSPLLLLFAGIFVGANDLKNPSLLKDQCTVLATGKSATPFKTQHNILYTNSGQDIHDLGLKCEQRGVVVVNDFDAFFSEVNTGDKATLTVRQYQLLPDRWHLDLKHTTKKATQARP